MHVTLVHIHVKPEHVEPFMTAILRNQQGTAREPGNVRFDVLQSADDPARFVLVEMFRDEEAAVAHKNTPHYKTWRDEVASWMAEPREGRRYHLLSPAPQR